MTLVSILKDSGPSTLFMVEVSEGKDFTDMYLHNCKVILLFLKSHNALQSPLAINLELPSILYNVYPFFLLVKITIFI